MSLLLALYTFFGVHLIYWAAGRYLVAAAPDARFGDVEGFVLGGLPILAVIVWLTKRGWINPPGRPTDEVSES